MLRRRNFSSSFMCQRVRFYQTACGSCSWTKKAATCAGLFASGMLFSYAYSRRMNAEEELVHAFTIDPVVRITPEEKPMKTLGDVPPPANVRGDQFVSADPNDGPLPPKQEGGIPNEVDGLCSLINNKKLDKIKEVLVEDEEILKKRARDETLPTLMNLACNVYGRAGVTPLMVAAYQGDVDTIDTLLHHKANPDQKSTLFPARENLQILQGQTTSRSAPTEHDVNLANIVGTNRYLQDLIFSAPSAWSRYLFKIYFEGLNIENQGLKAIDFAIAGKQYAAIARLLAAGSTEPNLTMHTANLTFEEKQQILNAVEEGREKHDEIMKDKRTKFPLEQRLAESIVGQRHAIGLVSSSIRRKENGWVDSDSPLVLLFMGSSGIGKTESAKLVAKYLFEGNMRAQKLVEDRANASLADFIFGSPKPVKKAAAETADKPKTTMGKTDAEKKAEERPKTKEASWMKCFIRMDMTEYQEKHEISKFIGAPPGYNGFDDGGQLVNKLKECPNAVVLLDEVEKANKDLLTVMLQAFDEGRLTDGQGNTVDCRDAIFVMTSNLGQQEIADEAIRLRELVVEEGGKSLSTVDGLTKRFKQTVIQPKLRQHFGRDEFLGRINEIVFFLPFTAQEQQQLAEKELKIWQKRAKARHNMDLSWTEDVTKLAAEGYDLRYGARSIKYEIDRSCIAPIARSQEEGKTGRGYKVQLDVLKPGEERTAPKSGKELWESQKDHPEAFSFRSRIKLNVEPPAEPEKPPEFPKGPPPKSKPPKPSGGSGKNMAVFTGGFA